MKNICVCIVLLLASAVNASEPLSLILYKENNFSGTQTNIFGEYLAQGIVHYGRDDLLAPVNVGNTSSIEVKDGYCAILSNQASFNIGSVWRVFSPGRYVLNDFDNVTNSLATYKILRNEQDLCDPRADIPMLYNDVNQNGAAYPLVTNMGNNPAIYYRADAPLIDLVNWHDKSVSLSVPPCYEVTLYRLITVSGGFTDVAPSSVFGPGNYNLSNYDFNKKADYALANRRADCASYIKPKVIIIPIPM